jgi:hypothetical protein
MRAQGRRDALALGLSQEGNACFGTRTLPGVDDVWGYAAEIDNRTVDVHIGRLRKALSNSKGRERNPIRTVRGTGYSLDETLAKS